jgi:hypothetical protein
MFFPYGTAVLFSNDGVSATEEEGIFLVREVYYVIRVGALLYLILKNYMTQQTDLGAGRIQFFFFF